MKVLAASGLCVLGACVLAPAVAWSQTVPSDAFTVLPPPSIDAPGATAVAPASTSLPVPVPQAAPASASTAIPIPALPSMRDNAPLDARGQPPPTVKVLKHKGKRVEEYYKGGQLYMVQVHPKHGVTYTYMVNKAHHLTGSRGAPQVNPVLYTILEWGKPDESH